MKKKIIFAGQALADLLLAKLDELRRAIERLEKISAHDALMMLRSSLSAPNLIYTLRTSPCSDNPILTSFDALLSDGLCRIVNVNISDLQWIQATFSIKDGGLGIRSVSTLAPSAFLASAAGTYELQSSILLRKSLPVTSSSRALDTAVDEALSIWQARYETERPGDSEVGKQRAWDMASIRAGKDILWMNAEDP